MTHVCDSHYLSRFAAFFIDARTKRSVVETVTQAVARRVWQFTVVWQKAFRNDPSAVTTGGVYKGQGRNQRNLTRLAVPLGKAYNSLAATSKGITDLLLPRTSPELSPVVPLRAGCSQSLARYRNKADNLRHELRTAMHHHPSNHEASPMRQSYRSLDLVSFPVLSQIKPQAPLLVLELPRLLAPDLPSNCSSISGLNCSHSDYKTKGPVSLFIVTTSLSVSQAPSPESNPNSPLPVATMVGHYRTIES
ncbi:hypothetical protein FF38_03793 [Lucilia cuprina]|uniref:Uncharacterized protein n=1 Tax=Lucilia cuprina TaxID=7375 RepID=A0A0L0C125_LUCCU|nr:hypothetical protein FF38_03793 [Lucilia cuprina]